MAQGVERQLENAKYDLRNIIQQLKTSSSNLKDIKGISIEACTHKIDKIINEYESVLRQLENVQLKREEDVETYGGNDEMR